MLTIDITAPTPDHRTDGVRPVGRLVSQQPVLFARPIFIYRVDAKSTDNPEDPGCHVKHRPPPPPPWADSSSTKTTGDIRRRHRAVATNGAE